MTEQFPAPKYPGDSIRIVSFVKRNDRGEVEFGSVRIQDYGGANKPDFRFRVASFLPGILQADIPGDTPKVWPEREDHAATIFRATLLMENHKTAAIADGWMDADYSEEQK